MNKLSFVIILACLISFDIIYADGCSPSAVELDARWEDYNTRIGFMTQADLDLYSFTNYPDTYKIGVVIHLILDAGETLDDYLNIISDDISFLNSVFENQVRIKFEVIKWNVIDNSSHIYDNMTIEDQENLCIVHNLTNAINVYYVKDMEPSGAGLATFSPELRTWLNDWIPDECARHQQYILISTKRTEYVVATLAHEMGHFFDLFHTHEKGIFGPDDYVAPEKTGSYVGSYNVSIR